MKKLLFVSLALAMTLATSTAAKADSFTINFFGDGINGSGYINGSSIGGGEFNITSGALTINGLSASIWPASSANPYPEALVFDDVLYTSASPYLDYSGLLFKLSNGTFVTLWAGNADDSAYGSFNYGNYIVDFTSFFLTLHLAIPYEIL